MLDLSDEYVAALVTIHSAAKVILALMENSSIFEMLQLKPEVEEVRKKMRKADGSSIGVFADSLAQEASWKIKLDAYVQSTNAAEIHLSKMKEVKAFLEKRSLRSDPKIVMQMVRDLGFLHSELPPRAFDQFMAEGLSFSKDYWTQSLQALTGGVWQHEQQHLQECMMECNLVWPEEATFSEAVHELAQRAAARTGQSKIGEFVACMEPMADTLKSHESTAAAVQEVQKHTRVCRGLKLDEKQMKAVHTAIDTLQAAALCVWGEGKAAPEILEMTECLEPWFAAHQGAKLLVMKLHEALVKALASWLEVGVNMTTLKPGPEKAALAALVRSHKAAAAHLDQASEADWGTKALASVHKDAGESLQSTQKMVIENAKEELEKQGQKVRELMALTGSGEKAWCDNITAAMDWDEALKIAGASLAKIPSDRLELETKDLYEVCLVFWRWGNTKLSRKVCSF